MIRKASLFVSLLFVAACGKSAASSMIQSETSPPPASGGFVFQAEAPLCTPYATGFFGCDAFSKSIDMPELTPSSLSFVEASGRQVLLLYEFRCQAAAPLKGQLVTDTGNAYTVVSSQTGENVQLNYVTLSPSPTLTLKIPAHASQIGPSCAFAIKSRIAAPNASLLAIYADALAEQIRELETTASVVDSNIASSTLSMLVTSAINGVVAQRNKIESRIANPETSDAEKQMLNLERLKIDRIIGDRSCGGGESCGLTKALELVKGECGDAPCSEGVAKVKEELATALKSRQDERLALVGFLQKEVARLTGAAADLGDAVRRVLNEAQ